MDEVVGWGIIIICLGTLCTVILALACGYGDDDPEGCDCTELCEMGPTCPGGMLARLPGSGCWRTEGDGDE